MRVPEEAIVLAGGFGTRLQHAIGDIPKPMAPVAGKPFLHYVLEHLASGGIRHVILSVGYKAASIREHFGGGYLGMALTYEVESEPLGTGGAVRASLKNVSGVQCFVVNGDSLFRIKMEKLATAHLEHNADVTMALKHLTDFDRYGTVKIDDQGRIRAFEEKKRVTDGLINGGIYLVNADLLRGKPEKRFSIEKDFFEREVGNLRIFGAVFDDYFIDIGIQADYERAQLEIG